MRPTITPSQKKIYEKIIEEATMDCHDEYEQIAGWQCILDEYINTPCKCIIGKEEVILEKIDIVDNCNAVVGVLKFNKTRLRVLIQDVILENQKAMVYIDAYKHWCKEGC